MAGGVGGRQAGGNIVTVQGHLTGNLAMTTPIRTVVELDGRVIQEVAKAVIKEINGSMVIQPSPGRP